MFSQQKSTRVKKLVITGLKGRVRKTDELTFADYSETAIADGFRRGIMGEAQTSCSSSSSTTSIKLQFGRTLSSPVTPYFLNLTLLCLVCGGYVHPSHVRGIIR